MSEFVAYLDEVFQFFGEIVCRRMFGGYGVYHEGLMFGLVADDVLYLKADAELAEQFEAKGLERFEYIKQGKPMSMSYYQAPEEIFDDPAEAKIWADWAYAAALRAKKATAKKHKAGGA